MKKAITYDAYLGKLNRLMRKHPDYRQGLRVTKMSGGLYEMTPPEPWDPNNPEDLRAFAADVRLQKVLWDCLAILKKKYFCADLYARRTRLPSSLLFRLSTEGRRSVRLQNLLVALYGALTEYRQAHGSWPMDVTPLIESYRLTDPWNSRRPLQVNYTPPRQAAGATPADEILAEYIREGKRRFVLYVDGSQDTWAL